MGEMKQNKKQPTFSSKAREDAQHEVNPPGPIGAKSGKSVAGKGAVVAKTATGNRRVEDKRPH